MGSRKENLKKSLGITEYPWSSDDDDDEIPLGRESRRNSRREPTENMPSTSGINSGQLSSEDTSRAMAKKNQAKRDRDLYWSIINNTPRPRPELPMQEDTANRPTSYPMKSLKGQQILDFKNMSRSLQNLEQSLSNEPIYRRLNIVNQTSSNIRVNISLPPSITPANQSRTTVQTGHTSYPTRTVASTSRAPHTRSAVSSSHIAPAPSRHTGSRNHHDKRSQNPRATNSNQHHIPSNNSRITTTSNNATPSSSWTAISVSQNGARTSAVAYTTSQAAPRPPWAAPSPIQARPTSWTTVSTSQARPSTWTTSSTRQSWPNFWTTASTNQGRTSSWNTASTSQSRSSSWNTPSTSQARPSSWNTASTSRSAPQDIPTSSCQQNRAGFPNGADWMRLLESPPSPGQLKEVYEEWRNENPDVAAERDSPPPQNQSGDLSRTDSQQTGAFVAPKTEPRENPTEEAEDLSTSNASNSGVRLIEEVVEVAAPDEAENLASQAPEAEEELQGSPSENSTNVAAITAVSENAVSVQPGPSYQGVKRKRDSNDDRREPFSVHDFNQNLLRLLECPVCLEWMEPPISQCRRGHLVCGRCRTRLSACPVCRTPFSSVRNRAMEGVAEMLRYPCRHGCGREVRLRRRGPHEASCEARRYQCPASDCTRHPLLPRDQLMHHFQCKHLPILKIGRKHKFSMKVNAEQHDTWLIMALDEYFHMRVDVDIRTWGVIVYVAYIGPKKNANNYYYEVTVQGQHNLRKLVYTRTTHSDLESSSVNVSRQDCFHLTLDQALNFLRINNRHCEPDKFLDFDVEITKTDNTEDSVEESD